MDSKLIKEAGTYYKNKNFKQANLKYQQYSSKQDQINPYLLINQASADYQDQQLGSALANLYQAKKLIPRNKELLNNLAVIHGKHHENTSHLYTFQYFNALEASIILFVANIIFLISLKFKNLLLKSLFSFIFFISILNFAYIYIENQLIHYAVINTVEASTYAGNSKNYQELYTLREGNIIKLLSKDQAGWYKIKHNGNVSWLNAKHFALIPNK
jgi:hypothetical protein